LKALGLAAVGALLLLAAIAGLAETGGAAAPQAAPVNQSPPTISGTPQEGSTPAPPPVSGCAGNAPLQDVLGGVSTRRFVSFPADLRR
jgi:hypothetical protein